MCKIFFIFFIINLATSFDISEFTDGKQVTTRKIIEETIEYFQTPDPYGIPVLSIPEPFEIRDPILVQAITLSNVSITGHSKIRLQHLFVELERLEGKVSIDIPKLEVIGDYLWPGYWSDSEGVLNITFVKLELGIDLNLIVGDDGILQVDGLKSSLENDEFLLDMTELAAGHQLLVFAGNAFFDTVVLPFVKSIIETEVLSQVNPKLKTMLVDQKLPIDIMPVDYLIAKLKKNIKNDQNFDPMLIPETEVDTPLPVTILVNNITLRGLSSLHRRGSLSAEVLDDKIYVRFLLGTQELKISCTYTIYSSIIYLMSGDIEFSIDELEVYVHIHQPVNIRYVPTLRKIDVKLGNFILMAPGNSNVEYLIEFAVNILPNIFRNSVLDKRIEIALKEKIQNEFALFELDKYVEEALDQFLPKESS